MTELTRHLGTLALAVAVAAGPAFAAPAPEPAKAVPPLLSDPFGDPDDLPMPDPDLWQRIRVGFLMEPLETPLVHEHEEWYVKRPEYIKRVVDRGNRYLHYIVEQVEKRGMPMEIALLPVIESAFTPKAFSRAKASGLWQFIPSTGKNYGLTQDWWRDNRNDVMAATDAALNYLQKLHEMFGSWELALAAYNCGEGCVGRAISYNQKRNLPTSYLHLRLPPETRNYVPKLIAVKNIVLSPTTYGIDLDSIPDQPYFTTVEAPARIDVKLAAKLAGMSEEDFVALNPAHNKPVAVASGGTLVVPLDKAETFRQNLEAYGEPLVTWMQYHAKRGESLDAIARRHGITYSQLKGANDSVKLDKRGRLRAAGPVLVPMRKGSAALASKPAVPARVATVAVPTVSAGTPPRPAAAAPAGNGASGTYVVRPGDTIYAIAQRYNTAVDSLLALNKLTARSVIHPGLRLRVP
ncbi:MAG TPA: transglycosylase SLT domain-containing protein [Usitatibacter sp.]|nr:transglycosylase SLT domain-containing protein [Usitatibacter sp.]